MERGKEERRRNEVIGEQRSNIASIHYSIYKPPWLAILPVPMTLLINILLGFNVFIALLMILVILMQRPKSEGLGAAFGGGVTENIFGAQTTNVLTKVTSWLAALFFFLTFGLSILYAHKGNTQSELRRELMKDLPPPVAGSPTPSPTAAAATGTSPTLGPTTAAAAGTSPTPSPSTAAAAGTSPTPSPTAAVATDMSPTPGASPLSSAAPTTSSVTPASSLASPVSSVAPTVAPSIPARRKHR